MRWLNPEYLFALLGVAWIAWRLLGVKRLRPTLRFPDAGALAAIPRSWATRLARLPVVLRVAALALFVVAMARPQSGDIQRRATSQGVDIALVLDVSGSMMARDLEPDRLEAAKQVAKEFVERRKGDRLSLVLFGVSAVTLCPSTLDYEVVKQYIDRIHRAIIPDNATAIGMGLAQALKGFEKSEAKSKIVVLLSDGVNNSGTIEPLQAAEAAHALGVRVYTIGVGTHGYALFPSLDPRTGREVLRPMEVEVDEPTLTRMAEMTGGRYYRATDTETLRQIYDDIDRLEKSEVEYVEYGNFDEKAVWLLLPALALLLLDVGLGVTRFGVLA